MDLVNIRKKAKQEKEKEGKTQESTMRHPDPESSSGVSGQDKTEEAKAEPREEAALKLESERIVVEEATTEEKEVELPALLDEVETAEIIKAEVPEVTPETFSEEEAEVEVISFQLGEETYGVKIDRVKEILKPLQITPVPRTPDYLTGVTSLRGEIVPVFDLKKRLGLEGQDEGKKRRILILSVRNETMGALIDEVKGVVKLRRESIEPPPTIITGVEADFLEGVSRIDNQFIGLLNIEEVMKI